MIRSRSTATPGAVADHYDELDPFYREIWGEHVHHGYWATGAEAPEVAVEALVELLAERVGLRTGMRVCDVGCGYGTSAALLAERHGCQVVGLTLSQRQVERAARRAALDGGLSFLRRDWLANGLQEGSFDAVLAIESTEHMADKAGAFREMRRVLKPGGRLGLCAWLAADGATPRQRDWLLEPICREGRLPSMLTVSELRDLVAVDFDDISLIDISRSVRRTWSICAARLARRVASSPETRRFLRDNRARNRIFAITVLRIMVAYRLGAMRYGLLTATRRN